MNLIAGADIDWVLAGAGNNTSSALLSAVGGGRIGTARGGGGLGAGLSLSSSFTASDSQVHTLTRSHPQSSPSARLRLVTGYFLFICATGLVPTGWICFGCTVIYLFLIIMIATTITTTTTTTTVS